MIYVDYTTATSGGSGDLSNYYTKSQVVALINSAVASGLEISEIELGYKRAYNTAYVEKIMSGNTISQINIWENSGRSVKLFTKTFTWTGNLLTNLSIKDETSGRTENKGFVYQDGVWLSTNISYGG